MVYKIVFTVDLATCKALNSLQTVQQTLHCTTCLFSCLFARFEGVADDPLSVGCTCPKFRGITSDVT